MRLRRLLSAWLLLWPAAAILAQARTAAGDPISGTWSGTLGNESRRTAATFAMKVDGKGAVSGVVTGPELTPGDVKTGTFDAKTGALKFSLAIRGEGPTINFEGAIAKDTLTVRASNPDGQGFILTLTKKAAGEAAVVQQPAPPRVDPAVAAVRRSFAEVSGWVTRAADLVPADKYTYRPAQTVRTFGQLIGHVADAYNYYCARAGGKEVQWSDAIEKGNTQKAAVVQRLKQSLAVCDAAYGGNGQIGTLIENVAHTSLHYGNIITYMRMLGLTPPSS